MNIRPIAILLLFFFLSVSTQSFSQRIIRNYSFEELDFANQTIGWRPQITKPDAYFVKLSKNAHEGDLAASISFNTAYEGESAVGLLNTGVAGNVLAGADSIRVSAFIKTKEVVGSGASIWMQLNGDGKIVRDINSDANSIIGSTEWTKVEIALPITTDVRSASFGCKFRGKGEALFDSFEVYIDGRKLE